MSLFDSASICITPNGVKEGKLYSIKPSDGSGDLSVTRATTATRVNSEGLIEVVPYNLLQYSEQIDNAAWTKFSPCFATANTTTAPNGTLTADTISTSSTSVIRQTISLNAQSVYSYSIYIKKIAYDFFGLQSLINGNGVKSTFNISTGVVVSQGSGHTASIQSVGNGWFRCSITFNVGSSDSNIFDLATDTSSTQQTFYAWGAQLVQGSSAKDYYPTTTRLNIPRLDYTNGSCPSILVEPQRTNILTYSNNFTNSTWTKANASISSNSVTSPDGTQNASKLVEDTANSQHYFRSNFTIVTSGSSYTYSIFAKKAERNFILLFDSYINSGYWFNLDSGIVGSKYGTGAVTAKIENYGNGWYRCSITFTAHSGGYALIFNNVTNANNVTTYTGNGTSGIYTYGAQLELGSYATSYIPTVAASITRNADVISKTGISSLIGQTEGTILFDADVTNTTGLQIGTTDGGSDYINSIQFAFGTSTTNVNVFNGGTLQFSYTGGVSTGRKKIAIAYKANDFALYINGVQIATDTSGTVPTLSGLFFNHQNLGTTNGKINLTALWKTRLDNATLATLTTI
jgi:hypothetical protein